MKTKIEIVEHQIHLQEKIQSAGFNIVECGNCGTVLLHELKTIDFTEETDDNGECVNNITDCFCGHQMSLTDCPDLYYSGMENNAEFEESA